MIKLTTQDYWQPEDDADAIIEKWLSEENAKIPADIRENLRGLFPQIGLSPDEADSVPESVAKYITTNSIAYQKYIKNENSKKSIFIEEALKHLQTLYIKLEFYATFIETVKNAEQSGSIYINSSKTQINHELPTTKISSLPKTQEEEQMLSFIVEIEKVITMFESIVPVKVAKYIGYDSHEIPEDTLATYKSVEKLSLLTELKNQAEATFQKFGYIQTGKNTFAEPAPK